MRVEAPNAIQMSDTMPLNEARRETSEFELTLKRGRFLGITDEDGLNFMSVRVKGNEKVYAKECHDGHISILGNVKLSEGQSYDVALGSKVVSIQALQNRGFERVFKVKASEGMVVQTDQK